MGGWVQAGVIVLLNLIITAYYFGSISTKVQEHERRLNDSDKSRKEQWTKIGQIDKEVEILKLKTAIGGAD